MSVRCGEPGQLPGESGDAVMTRGLTKRFGRETALNRVDLRVPGGSVYLLAGRNGAGKSTLLRVLLNIEAADGGTAEVLGLDPQSQGPRVRAQTGYFPEGAEGAYPWMSAGRLLSHLARFYPSWDRSYANELATMFDLRLDRRLGVLSKGQLRCVQVVAALAHRPPLLLLDELTDGLDPIVREDVLGALAGHLAETGCTAILSTHLVQEVERLVDQVGVLRRGRLVAQDSVEDILDRLRRYELDAPGGWSPSPALEPMIGRRGPAIGGATDLVLHGTPDKVAGAIAASGAAVRNVSRLPLSEAVTILLQMDERNVQDK